MHTRHLVKLLALSALAIAGMMAVNASAVQARYVLLLNGLSVLSLHLLVKILPMQFKAENGLEIKCTEGTGLVLAETAEGGEKVGGGTLLVYEGCKWVGSEKNCTISDPETGEETIHATATGSLAMPGGSEFVASATSQQFTVLITEGAGCTIPEEEQISGTIEANVSNPLEGSTVHLAVIKSVGLKLGNVHAFLEAEAHISDFLDPTATWAMHLMP